MLVIRDDLHSNRPGVPCLFHLLRLFGIVVDQIVCLAAVITDVVELPRAVLVAFVTAYQFPVTLANGARLEVIKVNRSLRQGVGSVQHRLKTDPGYRGDVMASECGGVVSPAYAADCRHHINQMNGCSHPAVGVLDALGPVSDKRAAVPSFMVEVLVHPQWRIAQARPATSHRVIRSGAANG